VQICTYLARPRGEVQISGTRRKGSPTKSVTHPTRRGSDSRNRKRFRSIDESTSERVRKGEGGQCKRGGGVEKTFRKRGRETCYL